MGLGEEDHIPTAQMALRLHLDPQVVSMTKTKVLSGRRKRRRTRLSSVPFKVNSAGGTKSKISSTQVTSSPLLPSFGTFFFSFPLLNLTCIQRSARKARSGEGRDAVCWPRISPTSHAAAADPLVTHTLPKAKLTASAAHWSPSGSPSHPGIAPWYHSPPRLCVQTASFLRAW